MKFHKISRRLAAALMAGTMMVSMVGMTAFAAPTETATASITKTITKEANVYAPKTDFTFTIAPGTAADATATTDAIYAGDTDWISIANNGVISSEPKDSDIGQTTVTVGTAAITVTVPKSAVPGIYRYVVSETAESYEGVGYTAETKIFDVYVTTEGASYLFVDSDNPKVKDDGFFTNEYGTGSADGEINNLTVEKVVEGNQGDKSKAFSFTIKVDGEAGENYYVTFSKGGVDPITLVSGKSQTITLADSESVTIYGLSEGDTYTVTETNYASDGYTTTIDGVAANTATGKITADTTIKVTNTKNVTTPTGVAMTVAPYILMVALAGVFAFLFLRRRNRAEY